MLLCRSSCDKKPHIAFILNPRRADNAKTKLNMKTAPKPLALLLCSLLVALLFNSCRDKVTNPPPVSDPPNFLTIDFEPAWSPDGKTIAFCRVDTPPSQIGLWLINADGTNPRQALKDGFFNSPTWSPDGQWLAFSVGAQLWKMKRNGDSLTQLTFQGRNFFPAWSPDGKYIAFDNTICGSALEPPPPNSCGLLTMRNNGSEVRLLVRYGRMPTWSPNEHHIAFIGLRSSVFRVKASDSLQLNQLTWLNPDEWDNRYPKYSPDGTKILFTSQTDGSFPQIWVMNADGSNLRQLTTTQGYSACWSPDGTRICYCDSRLSNGRLWIMNSDGSNKRQLTF